MTPGDTVLRAMLSAREAPGAAPALDPARLYPLALGSLIDAAACAAGGSYPAYYQRGLEWLTQFVMQPHRELGRAGAVCPFVAPALLRHLIWFGTVHTETTDPVEARDKAVALGDAFEYLISSTCEGDARLRASAALLAFFPDVPVSEAPRFIDDTHREVRMGFVARALMLGEFHPLSTVGAVRNPEFPVMRSPMPIFTVRALSPHDLLFLDTPATPPPHRVVYLRHYLRHLGSQLTARTQADVEWRIAEAETAMAAPACSPSTVRPATAASSGAGA